MDITNTEQLTIAHGEITAHHVAGLLLMERLNFVVTPVAHDKWLFEVTEGTAASTREAIGL